MPFERDAISEILPGRLFLGAEWDAHEAGLGNNPNGITHVLNVANVPILGCGVTPTGVSASWIPMSDDGGDDVFGVPQCLEEHKEAAMLRSDARLSGSWWHCRAILRYHLLLNDQDRLLVHCAVGVNRSVTIVLAWLMESRMWNVDQAFQHVEACRPMIDPVSKHMTQLDTFDEALRIARSRGQDFLAPPPASPKSVLKAAASSGGWQVTLKVPMDAKAGTLLSLPVKGGEKTVRVRVPEGAGPGSTLILTEIPTVFGDTEWSLKVGDVFPADRANGKHPQVFCVGDEVEGRFDDGNWYKARIASSRSDGTYLLNWADSDTRDRVKSSELLRSI